MSGLGMPKPKRVGQPDVEPLTLGALRIEVMRKTRAHGYEQNGGVIAAYDAGSGTLQWSMKVYTIEYIPKLETDVQDIFITTLAKGTDPGVLLVTDERGRRFTVDTTKRTSAQLP